MSDVKHRKRGLRFEKSVEFCGRKKKVDFRLLAEALWRVPHVIGGRWKSQHRKMVSLFLCRKTFQLKGNKKSSVPELRSRKCFLCFGIPMLSIYVLCIYVMNILCTFHVFLPGYFTYTDTHKYLTNNIRTFFLFCIFFFFVCVFFS